MKVDFALLAQPDLTWARFAAPDALEFCKAQGLMTAMDRCLILANKNLRLVGNPNVYLNFDPDDREATLTVFVTVQGPAEVAADRYEDFVREWAATLDNHALSKIHLSYSPVQP
jgi:hypothetical protein